MLRSTIHILAALLPAVLIAAAPVPVTPSGSATQAPSRATGASAPDVTAVRETPLGDLVREAVLGSHEDGDGRAAAMRTFVSERWGVGPDLSQPLGVHAVGTADLESEFNAWPTPVGDLDGDGGNDVVVTAWTHPDPYLLAEARRGHDGSRLWHVESDNWVEGLAWPAGADLTGDGIEDLVAWGWDVLETTTEDTCVTGQLFNCSRIVHTTYEHGVSVRSGADGSLVWSHRYPGEEHYEQGHRGAPAAYEYWEVVDATNAFVDVHLSGDHDGDGLRDLVVNVLGFAWDDAESGHDLVVTGESEGHSYNRYSTEADVVSGRTGITLASRTTSDTPTAGELRPVNTDGTALLWTGRTRPDEEWSCEYVLQNGSCSESDAERSAVLELLAGKDLATAWTRNIGWTDWVIPLHADLTGDGHPELFLEVERSEGWESVTTGMILDGADGDTRWQRDGQWFPRIVADLHGGGAADVLIESITHDGGVTTMTTERVDGSTGATLGSTDFSVDQRGANIVYTAVEMITDLTGDGVDELAMHVHRLWNDDVCEEGQEQDDSVCHFFTWRAETVHQVENTRTGAALLPPQTHGGYAWISSAGDLTGDGTPDLLRLEAAEGPLAHVALDGRAGTEVWRSTHDLLTLLAPSGDQDGDGLGDLVLEARDESDDARTSFIGGIDGWSGAERWRQRYG